MNYIYHDEHNSQTRSRTHISKWKHRTLFTALICLLGFILNLSYGNANQLWHTAQAQLLIPTDSLTVDTSDIEASRAFFYNIFGPDQDIEMSWDGDHESCNPGQEDSALGAMLLQRVNYYRAMAGVPADVTFSEEYNEKAQQAALVMSANNNLSHGITPDWECYTDEADEASRSSNLALYYNQDIWDFVSLYIQDTSNYYVGHRRWILHPNTKVMGSGTVPQTGEYRATNALWIVDMDNLLQPRPQTREDFIAWPPAGYVPYQVTYALWSFAYPGADYSATTITMLEDGAEIPVKVEQEYQMSILDNTLVWTPNEMGPDDAWNSVEDEVKYTVTLHDVMVDGGLRDFTYDVILFDPLSAPPQPTATPTEIPTETPAPTDTPEPTATPEPTDTPESTATPEPTETPVPTDTPEPTATPEPTDTPIPTDTPEPTVAPTFTPEPTTAVEDVPAEESESDSDQAAEITSDEGVDEENAPDSPAENNVETESLSEALQEEDAALVTDIDLAGDQSVDESIDESDESEALEADSAASNSNDVTVGTANDTQIADLSTAKSNENQENSEARPEEDATSNDDDITVDTNSETQMDDSDQPELDAQEGAEDQSQSEELEEDGTESDAELNRDVVLDNDTTEGEENALSDEAAADLSRDNTIRSEEDASMNGETENATEMIANEIIRFLFLPLIAK